MVSAPVKDPILVTYAPSVAEAIRMDTRRRRNAIKSRNAAGEESAGDPDSHALLTRIKAATLLAVWLDQCTHVSDEMWELSGWVMWISNDTRVKAHRRIQAKSQEKALGRAAAAIAQRDAINADDERKHRAVYIKALDRALHLLATAGDWQSISQVRKRMAGDEKKAMRLADVDLADVLGDLEIAKKIESREPEGNEQGARFRSVAS